MNNLLLTRMIENYEYVALFVSVLAGLFWLSLVKKTNPDTRKVIKAVFRDTKDITEKQTFVAKGGPTY
jgi:hypothetical protein